MHSFLARFLFEINKSFGQCILLHYYIDTFFQLTQRPFALTFPKHAIKHSCQRDTIADKKSSCHCVEIVNWLAIDTRHTLQLGIVVRVMDVNLNKVKKFDITIEYELEILQSQVCLWHTKEMHKIHFFTVNANKQFYLLVLQLLSDQNINNIAHARIQRGREGPDPPLENHKNIGFLSNTGPDSLKNHIAYSSILILSSAKNKQKKRSGSVVECLTRGREAAGSSLTVVTALCP